MNLYIRYFDEECVVGSVEEAVDFLSSIPGVTLDDFVISDLRQYVAGSVHYPKRYKVRPRVYFIVIKTMAATLEEFKAHGGKGQMTGAASQAPAREFSSIRVMNEAPGWYEGSILFKRVISIPGTTKFQYKDTSFCARVKAHNATECYNRIVAHLRQREDVDPRSQFPSMKGRNFTWKYLGVTLPTA
ncbi:MAG: hypothetical protein NC388_09220 [Clostridium sp.]|nr:hypothetical protein [Clostridium sp.]